MNARFAHPCPLRGMSIIELVVGIMIICVLVILSNLATTSLQRQTQSARCLSNLRVLGAGVLAWSADNGERLPSRIRRDESGKRIYNWMEALERGGYVTVPARRPDNPLFFCPSGPKPSDSNEGYGMRQWGAASGGVRVKEDEELPLSFIEYPSRFLLLADCIRKSVNGYTQWYTIPNDSAATGVGLLHQKRANAVFADGHAATMDREFFETHHLAEPTLFRPKDKCYVLDPSAPL